MPTNPLIALNRAGQSVWLDNLARPLIAGGKLTRLIREDGISGITSNPVIFRNAMLSGTAYDAGIHDLAAVGRSTREIYETLAIEDIQAAADQLRPVHEATAGVDGQVSLEVSPHLARDADGTVAEARRLWEAVDRPNLLIKIPGTSEALPAIEECLATGINVNITLLFSIDMHRQVIDAYFRALTRRQAAGQPLNTVASVASFFLSRIDTAVDAELDALIARGDGADDARALAGRAAVASAQLAYGLWTEMHTGDRWAKLARGGARVQRPLWASTSTKNPDYSDVMYVEPLVGPSTVNTMPEVTIDAFRDHGEVARRVDADLPGARDVTHRLAGLGVDLPAITDRLVSEGITKFIDPFDELLATLDGKRVATLPADQQPVS
ncbi:MAG: transaldolase [Acidobacteriota bacterium]